MVISPQVGEGNTLQFLGAIEEGITELKQIKIALGLRYTSDSSRRRKRDESPSSTSPKSPRGTRTGARSLKAPPTIQMVSSSKYISGTRAGNEGDLSIPRKGAKLRSRPPTLPSVDSSSLPFVTPGDPNGNDEFRPHAASELRSNFARSRLLPSLH